MGVENAVEDYYSIMMNKDYVERDKLLGIEVDWEANSEGICYFTQLDMETLLILIRNRYISLLEYHNNVPGPGSMLDLMEKSEDVRAGGYATSPFGPNYRISINAIIVTGELGQKMGKKQKYGQRDVYTSDLTAEEVLEYWAETADEVTFDGKEFRLWWDRHG
jgi:hypothetical protein